MPDGPDAWADVVRLVEISRADTPPRRPAARARPRRMWLRFLLLAVLPTLLVGGYLYGIAADRYEAEARYVVRKVGAPGRIAAAADGLEAPAKEVGGDDSYLVRDYLQSRDAMRLLLDRADLRGALSRSGNDPLWRFPGGLNGDTDEDLYRLYQSLVSVDYLSSTGLTVLRVQGFTAEDARRMATTLLAGAEALVNRLNERAHGDAVKVAERQVAQHRAEARQALSRVTAFRDREAMIDPTLLAKTVTDTIAALSLQLVEASAQLDMTEQASRNSPQLAPLRARVRAIRAQIDRERGMLGGNDRALAGQVAEYERLSLERDFAEKGLLTALAVLETARMEAERQQQYVERVVEPVATDKARYPRAALWTGATFLLGFAAFWLFRPPRDPVRA